MLFGVTLFSNNFTTHAQTLWNRLMIYIAFFGWPGSNKFKQAELLLFMHAYWELLHTYNCAMKKYNSLQASVSHFTRKTEPPSLTHTHLWHTHCKFTRRLIPSDIFSINLIKFIFPLLTATKFPPLSSLLFSRCPNFRSLKFIYFASPRRLQRAITLTHSNGLHRRCIGKSGI